MQVYERKGMVSWYTWDQKLGDQIWNTIGWKYVEERKWIINRIDKHNGIRQNKVDETVKAKCSSDGKNWNIFLGIHADNIIKVTEFASGLRDSYI